MNSPALLKTKTILKVELEAIRKDLAVAERQSTKRFFVDMLSKETPSCPSSKDKAFDSLKKRLPKEVAVSKSISVTIPPALVERQLAKCSFSCWCLALWGGSLVVLS